ncbi:MAG: ATP synthase F0 subunit B [Terracidiphilus sp.]
MRYSIARSRFSVSLLWFAFAVALLAGFAVAPHKLAAQEPASASQPQPQPQPDSQAQAKPEAAKSEAGEEDKFLLTPTVHAAAKALNLSDRTMANVFMVINFAILFLAIVVPLARFSPKFLRNRAAKLREDIESARKVTEDANSRLSAVEAKLASLGDEIARFRAEVEKESLQDEARIKATLEDESARIVAAAEQEIGVAAAQARRTLRHFAADLAIEQAAKKLVLTPETDRALIAEFVGDVAKGGLN